MLLHVTSCSSILLFFHHNIVLLIIRCLIDVTLCNPQNPLAMCVSSRRLYTTPPPDSGWHVLLWPHRKINPKLIGNLLRPAFVQRWCVASLFVSSSANQRNRCLCFRKSAPWSPWVTLWISH